MDFKKVTFLKVYTGEDVIVEDMPLFKAVIKEAMRLKLAGGTVTRGIGGYASVKRGIDYKIGSFFTGLPNMPVTVGAASIIKSVRSLRGCPICR